MKKFVLCLGVIVSLEAQASTVVDTWEQWNPLSRLWAQEQVRAPEEEKDEETPVEASSEVPDPECGCLVYKKDKGRIIEGGIRLLIPTYAVECMKQWFVKLRQGDLATIVLTALGSAGVTQLIRILCG